MEVFSSLGVPVYAERGREGGFRLLEGYFLPPLMGTPGEAIALLVGLTLQRSLQATPFPTERQMAEKNCWLRSLIACGLCWREPRS